MKKYSFRYSISEMTVRLFGLARPIRGYLTVSTLASVFGNLAHMGLMGFGAMWIMTSAGISAGNPSVYGILAAACAILIALGRYCEGVFSHIGAYGVLAKLRIRLFECLDRGAPALLVDRKQGDIMNIAVSDIETLEFFFAHMIGPGFTVFILPITTLIIAAHFHIFYALTLLPVYILISIVIPLLALKAGRRIGMRSRENLGELKSIILESVYGMKDIQIFGFGAQKIQQMLRQNREVNRASHSLMMHRQIVSSLPSFFVSLARILILLIATYLTGKQLGDPVGTTVISLVAAASFSSTFSLTAVVSQLLETYAAAERFFIIEDSEPAVKETDHPEYPGDIGELSFENVTFCYPGTDKEILKDVSFHLKKGEHVGLVGESGVGKSTVLRLLMHFYEPRNGQIRLNRVSLRNVSMKELHSRVAMLEQETSIFDCSIAENIALGKPSASMAEIQEAARRAGIADFIATLPQGYETQMGQMGNRLSGGERQRIGLARIMLTDPDVVIMDEPTSSLDVLHEQELLKTLRSEYTEKTILIISHRMSTLEDCGRLLRMEGGSIREEVPLHMST